MQDKLADAKLELIKKWIEGGRWRTPARRRLSRRRPLDWPWPVRPARADRKTRPCRKGSGSSRWCYTARGGGRHRPRLQPLGPARRPWPARSRSSCTTPTRPNCWASCRFPRASPTCSASAATAPCCWPAAAAAAIRGCAVSVRREDGQAAGRRSATNWTRSWPPTSTTTTRRIALGGPQRLVRIYSTETGREAVTRSRSTPIGSTPSSSARTACCWPRPTARTASSSGRPTRRGSTSTSADTRRRSPTWPGGPIRTCWPAAAWTARVKLWEMNDGKTIKSWNAHGGGVQCVDYTHDGRLATAGRDNTAKVWDGDGKR